MAVGVGDKTINLVEAVPVGGQRRREVRGEQRRAGVAQVFDQPLAEAVVTDLIVEALGHEVGRRLVAMGEKRRDPGQVVEESAKRRPHERDLRYARHGLVQLPRLPPEAALLLVGEGRLVDEHDTRAQRVRQRPRRSQVPIAHLDGDDDGHGTGR
jgi:hypothetical protein